MTAQNWAIFVSASLLLALTPGPDILTVLTRSVSQGTRAGLAAALGFASGLTVHTTLAAAGVAAVMKTSPHAMLILKSAGAAYLLYLALRIALDRSPLRLAESGAQPRRRLLAIYGQSVLMNVLNPKVTLFFLGFLPGFVDPATPLPAWAQIVSLGVVFALCTLLCFGGCALFAGAISASLLRKASAANALRWATVALFVLIAAWIAL